MQTDFQLFVSFLNYLPNKTAFFKENKIVQKSAIFGPNSPPPPDAQYRFLLEVKQMPQ